jgi:hypothetical protein
MGLFYSPAPASFTLFTCHPALLNITMQKVIFGTNYQCFSHFWQFPPESVLLE